VVPIGLISKGIFHLMDLPVKGYTVGRPELLEAPIRWKGERILLKLPPALLRHSLELSTFVREVTGKEVIISARPSFGACDISPGECSLEGLAGVLDLGHAPMPTVYGRRGCRALSVPLEAVVDKGVLEKVLESIPLKSPATVGLLTTAQHLSLLKVAEKVLGRRGFRVLVGRGGKRLFFPGQVLGCDLSAARAVRDDVDLFLYIGTGQFHPRGVALSTGKRVLTLDPLTGLWGEVEEGERERFIRRRYGAMMMAKELIEAGEPVGIYMSNLLGQRREALAYEIRDRLLERGIEAFLFQSELLTPGQVSDLSLKVLVNTACPRIAVDDYPLYSEVAAILLTPLEMIAILEEKPPEDYVLDEF